MVTDGQVRKLRRLLSSGRTLAASARMTGMDEKTARSYRDHGEMPSERKSVRTYRTRVDPFSKVWPEVQERLEAEPRLQAKTLLDWLQDRYPGQFPDSTRRTFERRVRRWRSTHGPAKTVTFPQVHHPGRIAASDFTVMNSLGVTIGRSVFEHTLFHCVLTYSNVESVSLCFSESFEALSEGVQKAFWEFGGVPKIHRTDSLSAAINNHSTQQKLTSRYRALMEHYEVESQQTNARCPNENGDVESSNGHIKNVIDQALLLRGSRSFESREQYMEFVEEVVARRNHERRDRFAVEQEQLGPLPHQKLDTNETLRGISVRSNSTIQVRRNRYSVPSRLIGGKVDVTISAEWIDVSHHGTHVQRMPRLLGVGGSAINYRHVIDSLVRKPGAFENYKYREDMFPTSHFRIAYDLLCEAHSAKVAVRQYLKLLALAAHESQDAVQDVLRTKIQAGDSIDVELIRELVLRATEVRPVTEVDIESPDLKAFDSLLQHPDMEGLCDDPIDPHDKEAENSFTESDDESVSCEGTHREEAESQSSPAAIDRAVSRVATPDVSRTFSEHSGPRGSGGNESLGLPFGVDDVGMRSPKGRTNSPIVDPLATAAEQELGELRLPSSSACGDSSVGESPGRIVFGSAGELADLRQAGRGQESRPVRVGRAADSTGAEHALYDVQLAGSAVANCETGPASAEVNQAAFSLRRPLDRRPGLCPAKSRGDGGVVHTAGGALRTRERVADEQPGVQQVGSNLQGCDDDRGRDRSARPSQRDPRTERAELPSRNGQARQIATRIRNYFATPINFLTGNSSCR